MPRLPSFTEDQFMEAYNDSLNVWECAEKLGISTPTVYHWIRKLGLPTFKKIEPLMSIEMCRHVLSLFTPDKAIEQIALEQDISISTARRNMKYAVSRVWKEDEPPLPYPRTQAQLQIANHIYDFQKQRQRATWTQGPGRMRLALKFSPHMLKSQLMPYLKELRCQ